MKSVLKKEENYSVSEWSGGKTKELAIYPPKCRYADRDFIFRLSSATVELDESDFTVQQLCEEVAISRVHLNRKMKKRYGVSPNIFIRSFRLKQAAYLLAYNKANISEVAYAVGFSSHSYFTTSFREYFGMSPKEFALFYSEEENKEALQKLLELD